MIPHLIEYDPAYVTGYFIMASLCLIKDVYAGDMGVGSLMILPCFVIQYTPCPLT